MILSYEKRDGGRFSHEVLNLTLSREESIVVSCMNRKCGSSLTVKKLLLLGSLISIKPFKATSSGRTMQKDLETGEEDGVSEDGRKLDLC